VIASHGGALSRPFQSRALAIGAEFFDFLSLFVSVPRFENIALCKNDFFSSAFPAQFWCVGFFLWGFFFFFFFFLFFFLGFFFFE